jgi:hypothetical protein
MRTVDQVEDVNHALSLNRRPANIGSPHRTSLPDTGMNGSKL